MKEYTLKEVEELYSQLQEMEDKRYRFELGKSYSDDYVFDEEKSVKWNREEALKRNKEQNDNYVSDEDVSNMYEKVREVEDNYFIYTYSKNKINKEILSNIKRIMNKYVFFEGYDGYEYKLHMSFITDIIDLIIKAPNE